MSTPDLSIVVPVYNNAATLDQLLDRLLRVVDTLGVAAEIILVDDGSIDGSWAILERRAAAEPRLRPFALVRNFGSQAALCAGFDQVRGRRAVCLDADLENLPEDVPALLVALDHGADLACGVRTGRRGSHLRRRLPSALFNAFVRHQVGMTVRDIGCGMRAMDAGLVQDLASEGDARRLLTPLLVRRARRVIEVPVRWAPSPGRSRHSFLTLLGIAVDFYLLTARRPFLVASLAALAAIALGLPLGLVAAATARPLLGLAALVLVAVGGLAVVVALAGEYAQRLYELRHGAPFYTLRPRRSPTPYE